MSLDPGTIQPFCFERFFRILIQTFIKAHRYYLQKLPSMSFCHCCMWSLLWCLTWWKLAVTFWPLGSSGGLLMEQGTGEDLPFGSMCSTVGLSLMTATTALFPLRSTDEALSNFDMVLIIWKSFPSIYKHAWWQIVWVETKSSVSRKLWFSIPNWKGKTTLSK